MKEANIREKLAQIWQQAQERDAQRSAQKSNLQYLNLTTMPVDIEALGLISEEEAKKAKAIAFSKKESRLAIALVDPDLAEAKDLIKKLESKGFNVNIFVVSLKSLAHGLGFYKFISDKKGQITGKIEIEEDSLVKNREKVSSIPKFKEAVAGFYAKNVDTVQILEIILSGALANKASDVHFEAGEYKTKLKIRVDGLLNDIFDDFSKDFYIHLISRIKLLSGLKLNIHDEPQDGRFTIELNDKKVEVRVAIAPSEFGEVVVMRLLDPSAINLDLHELGIREDDLEIIKTEIKRPNGMILNTGPTGSGKTTTLYSFLNYKKSPEIKIITIEDPIEYHLDDIEQTQVDEEGGYDFANGLRSLMRQDPDVILVGEIRDKETVEIGIQAALTGHLVFSTVHANSASGAIPRLIDLGVKPSSIGPALNLIIAQRLVRRLCSYCKKSKEIDENFKNKLTDFINKLPQRVNRENYKEIKIYEPAGCEKCNNLGYKGRIGIYELLLNDPEYEKIKSDSSHQALSVDKDLEELILKQATEQEIRQFAKKQGMVAMAQDGVLKVISGITTLEEVEEVTGTIEF